VKRIDRYRSLKFLVILTIVLAAILAGAGLVYMPHLRNQSLSNLMHHKTMQSINRFHAFIQPVVTNLQVLCAWGQQGILEIPDALQLEKICIPMLNAHMRQVSGLMIADTGGNAFHLLKRESGWTGQPPDEKYDPGKSPWFQGAMAMIQADEVFWTSVYAFPGSDMPGVTASMRYQISGKPDKTFVVALKIALKEIEGLIAGMPLGAGGRLLLVEDDFVRDFTRLKSDSWQQGDTSALTSLSLLNEPDIANGLSAWQKNGSGHGIPVSFRSQNRSWWIEVDTATIADNDMVQIAVLLPDRQLQAETSRVAYMLLYGTMAVLVITLVFFLVLLRKYGREAEDILEKHKYTDASEEEILDLIRQGESDSLEFKSTLRWNLNTNKPDKNIALASLKTMAAFLNSGGGTLLIGVEDDGNILGIDMQNFANEDKYLLHFNNLIKQHIGLEFVQHIAFALKALGEKKILVIDCEPAEEPVFVKQNGEEDFYVRVGPGSRKLPPSKVLEYLKSRDAG